MKWIRKLTWGWVITAWAGFILVAAIVWALAD